ncbi:uncharacterized protein LOC130790987 [Actinidia eriantha]|uniref:uncharacterized protein LOC130790987 n=1 Tax=Actinidia eriantha TaxID=165200 RepID=UPI002582850D|nr:uncharacterized protein LOC130790987 [Actinidia eriantha]
MWRMLTVMRRNLQNMRKSPRVADENMFGDRNGAELAEAGVVRAPISLLSCLSQPHISGADGVWVSSELGRISEMNHLMVNDSLRYAILM